MVIEFGFCGEAALNSETESKTWYFKFCFLLLNGTIFFLLTGTSIIAIAVVIVSDSGHNMKQLIVGGVMNRVFLHQIIRS
jgi:hypothetical protein